MANLTMTLSDDLLKKARNRALEMGSSVNALIRESLEGYAGVESARQQAVSDLLGLARESRARRGGRSGARDALHER